MRQTSIEAYNAILADGTVSRRERQVYDYLYKYGPATAREVSGLAPGGWKRLSKMCERGMVVEVGYMVCPISQRRVILWDVTASAPKKLPVQPRASRFELLHKIAELEGINRGLADRVRQLGAGEGGARVPV